MASLALDQDDAPAAERTSRGSGELIDARAITADLEKLAKAHTGNERELRSLVAQKLKVALDRRPRQGRATAAEGPSRAALRRAALQDGRRGHPHPVRIRAQAPLSVAKPERGRTHGGCRDRRLRPRAAGARLRHRSVVSVALQADRMGRVDRRSHSLLPVGSRAEGRPRHSLGRRMHPPGEGGHDHPHRHSRSALPARRPQIVTTNW